MTTLVIVLVIVEDGCSLFETCIYNCSNDGLASIFSPQDYNLMVYPLAIGGACIITSIIGTWFVKLGKNKNIMGALYKGFIVTAITSLIIMYPITVSIIGLKSTYNNNARAIFLV